MSQHHLKPLFAPKSVAIFGASDKPDSIGQIVMHNMRQSGFKGGLYPINPKHQSVQGAPAFANLGQLKQSVDLAVIATPAARMELLAFCNQVGWQHLASPGKSP